MQCDTDTKFTKRIFEQKKRLMRSSGQLGFCGEGEKSGIC